MWNLILKKWSYKHVKVRGEEPHMLKSAYYQMSAPCIHVPIWSNYIFKLTVKDTLSVICDPGQKILERDIVHLS